MSGRLALGLFSFVACFASLGGCMSGGGPTLSAQDPNLRAAILANARGDRPDLQVRAQVADQEPLTPAVVPASVPGEGPATAAQIAVLVNGQAILEEEVRSASMPALASIQAANEAERAAKTQEIRKKTLDSLIEREVVLQEAMNRLGARGGKVMEKLREFADKEFRKSWMKPIMDGNNLKTEQELEDVLQKSGTSLPAIKYGWERNLMSQEYLRNRVYGILDRIGIEQVLEYYRKHPDEFKVDDTVLWQDIFIDLTRHPSREEARRFSESLAQRARNGEDFVKLAESFDNGDASLRKDAVGIGRKKGEIRPTEVEDVLFRLREKDVGPVVETLTGFHIVRALERTYAGTKPFDEKVQKLIREKLRNDLATKEMKRIVNELKNQAIIEYPKP